MKGSGVSLPLHLNNSLFLEENRLCFFAAQSRAQASPALQHSVGEIKVKK